MEKGTFASPSTTLANFTFYCVYIYIYIYINTWFYIYIYMYKCTWFSILERKRLLFQPISKDNSINWCVFLDVTNFFIVSFCSYMPHSLSHINTHLSFFVFSLFFCWLHINKIFKYCNCYSKFLFSILKHSANNNECQCVQFLLHIYGHTTR